MSLYGEVAELELKLKYFQRSIISFTEALGFADVYSFYFFRGVAKYEIGDYEGAVSDFEETSDIFENVAFCTYEGMERRIKRNPKLAEIRKYIGYASFRLNKYQEASDHQKKIKYKQMKISNIQFPTFPIALAPMEDVTNDVFRLMCRKFGYTGEADWTLIGAVKNNPFFV